MQLRSNKQCMQDTKRRSLYPKDYNNLKMHVRNNKRHKIREIKDQSYEIIKNILKINEEHIAYIRKMQEE